MTNLVTEVTKLVTHERKFDTARGQRSEVGGQRTAFRCLQFKDDARFQRLKCFDELTQGAGPGLVRETPLASKEVPDYFRSVEKNSVLRPRENIGKDSKFNKQHSGIIQSAEGEGEGEGRWFGVFGVAVGRVRGIYGWPWLNDLLSGDV